MSKHDRILLEMKVDGKLIGWLIQPRTARQAWEEQVMCAELRKQWRIMIESSKNTIRVPVFGDHGVKWEDSDGET